MAKACPHCSVKHRPANEKEKRWADEYIVDLNASRATVAVGYSRKSPKTQGYQILQRPPVCCLVRQLKLKQSVRTQIRADEVLGGIHDAARFDLGVLFDINGDLLPILSWPEWARRVVASIEIEPGGTKKVKLPDRLRAYELLGRHLKLFTDVLHHTGELTLRERMARGRRKAKDEEKD